MRQGLLVERKNSEWKWEENSGGIVSRSYSLLPNVSFIKGVAVLHFHWTVVLKGWLAVAVSVVDFLSFIPGPTSTLTDLFIMAAIKHDPENDCRNFLPALHISSLLFFFIFKMFKAFSKKFAFHLIKIQSNYLFAFF